MNGLSSHTKLLMEMLSIPAVSGEEQQRSDFLESYLQRSGYELRRIHHNLLLGNPEARGPVILLNSHLDTVPPAEGWESDPYTPVLNGDKVTALGSNDAGASVVTMLAAYGIMKERLKERMNLLLLISAEEEVSGEKGIVSVLPVLDRVEAVIVGEPTGMHPAVAERGLMVLDAEVKGKAGHAARNEGLNAIHEAMEDIRAIGNLTFSRESAWLPEPGAHVTMISAGTRHNVVPDVCRYVVDVRSNDQYGNEALLEMIRSVCKADLIPRSTRLKPSGIDPDHYLMQAIQRCNFKPFGSSTLSDMALIPFPAVKMGPGDSARSHTAGEYILISEMDEGIATYCQYLENIKPKSSTI
jgi:acetylornithine deacetylase